MHFRKFGDFFHSGGSLFELESTPADRDMRRFPVETKHTHLVIADVVKSSEVLGRRTQIARVTLGAILPEWTPNHPWHR